MKDKMTTIDDLARMINEGFKTTASKEDLKAVTTRLDGIDSRLDRIEHLLLGEQKLKNRAFGDPHEKTRSRGTKHIHPKTSVTLCQPGD